MLNSLLTSAADKTRTVPISEAALYAVLGFAIVFVGIAFLILVVWLVGRAMVKANAGVGKVKEIKTPVAESIVVADVSEDLTDETVAVITAAIMAYYQQTNPKCEFTVKRIKRI